VRGRGVLVARDLTRAEEEIISGLSQVVRRLRSSSGVSYLSESSIAEVIESNRYRRVPSSERLSTKVATAGGFSSSTA